MNDFTKDELEWIKQSLSYYESDGGLNIDEISISASVFDKLQSMIGNYCDPSIDRGHLNNKHIDQWAGYLLEELPNYEELIQDDGLAKIFIEMYKKGFQDCKTVGGTRCR